MFNGYLRLQRGAPLMPASVEMCMRPASALLIAVVKAQTSMMAVGAIVAVAPAVAAT
jgi:hypothetical protein